MFPSAFYCLIFNIKIIKELQKKVCRRKLAVPPAFFPSCKADFISASLLWEDWLPETALELSARSSVGVVLLKLFAENLSWRFNLICQAVLGQL